MGYEPKKGGKEAKLYDRPSGSELDRQRNMDYDQPTRLPKPAYAGFRYSTPKFYKSAG